MDGSCDVAAVCEQAIESLPPEALEATAATVSSDASVLAVAAAVEAAAAASVAAESADACVPAADIGPSLQCEALSQPSSPRQNGSAGISDSVAALVPGPETSLASDTGAASDTARAPESPQPCKPAAVTESNEEIMDAATHAASPELGVSFEATAVPDDTDLAAPKPDHATILEACDEGLVAAGAKVLPRHDDGKLPAPWHASIQGPWETSRLGFITVVGERILQRDTGKEYALSLAPDGRFALSNWRASAQDVGSKLEWVQVDDPVNGGLVLWNRPASYEKPKHPFDTLQGRWEATQFGHLRVDRDSVRYDAWAPSRPPLRLAMESDGRVALRGQMSSWKADVHAGTNVVRWTRDGDLTRVVITWVRRSEDGSDAALQLKTSASGLVAAVKQRAVKPRASARRSRDSSKSTNQKEMQRLKERIGKYKSEEEKLKLKIEKKERREQEKEHTPKKSKKKREKEHAMPAHIAQKRPRAKATARKALKEAKANSAGGADGSDSDDEGSTHLPLFGYEWRELQAKISKFDDDQFDKVILFLEPELGKPKGNVIRLDARTVASERQHALVTLVDSALNSSRESFESSQVDSGDSSSGSSSSSSSDSDSTSPRGHTQ